MESVVGRAGSHLRNLVFFCVCPNYLPKAEYDALFGNRRNKLMMRGHANLSALVAMKRLVAVIDQQNSICVRQHLRRR